MKNEVIRIAIIDDGINPQELYTGQIIENILINDALELEIDNTNPSVFSHGTICASILYKYFNNCEIISINIIQNNSRVNITKLIKAIEISEEYNVNIIHLAVGTNDLHDYYELLPCVNKLLSKNIITIAASSKNEKITFPAYYSNVIGVMHSNFLLHSKYRLLNNNLSGVNILVNVSEEINTRSGDKINIYGQSSFAVSIISAIISKLMYESSQQLTLVKLKKELGIQNPHLEYNIDWVQKPLIFIFATYKLHIDYYNIIFQNSIVEFIICQSIIDGLKRVNEYLRSLNRNNLDIVLCNFNVHLDESLYIPYYDYIFKNNIISLIDNTLFEQKITSYSMNRLFTINEYKSKTNFYIKKSNNYIHKIELINISKPSEIAKIIKCYSEDTITFSSNSFDILYGFEYIPYEIYKNNNDEFEKIIRMYTTVYGYEKGIYIINDYKN
jgi:hypothetical protein